MLDSLVQQRAKARLGKTLRGKWLLEELVGVGGMAAVYRASHRNGARVAVKMLHAIIAESDELRRRFIGEGYAANRIAHPAVVSVHDDDMDEDGTPFLVMDFVEGQTLADKILTRRYNDDELLDTAEQVCSLLDAAHKAGVVHRDLKPDNLLVEPDGRIRLLDFGIARLLEDGEESFHGTKTGIAFGTPGFISPEQALGHRDKVGPHTDVFALGATLFYLATGEFLHAAETPQELLILVATQPARLLREVAPHISPEVAAIVDRATRMRLRERYTSAAEMLKDVQALKAARLAADPRVSAAIETLLPPEPVEPEPEPIVSRESIRVEVHSPSLRDIPTRPSIARRDVTRRRSVLAVAGAIAIVIGGISFMGAARGREVPRTRQEPLLAAPGYIPPLPDLESISSQAVSDEATVVPPPAPPVQTKSAHVPPKRTFTSKKHSPKNLDPEKLIDALLAGKNNENSRRTN